MANRNTNFQKAKQTKSTSNIKFLIPILTLIAIIGFLWLVLLQLELLPKALEFGLDFTTWLNVWMVIFILLIVVLVCIPLTGDAFQVKEQSISSKTRTKKTRSISADKATSAVTIEPDDKDKPVSFIPLSTEDKMTLKAEETQTIQEPKPEIKSADVIAPPLSKDKMKPIIIEYPSEVEGGIYGDTFINLDEDRILKLRTLVVSDIYLL